MGLGVGRWTLGISDRARRQCHNCRRAFCFDLSPVLPVRHQRADLPGHLGPHVRQRLRQHHLLRLDRRRRVHAGTGRGQLPRGGVGRSALPVSRRRDSLLRAYGYVELVIAAMGLAIAARAAAPGRRCRRSMSSYAREASGWYALSTGVVSRACRHCGAAADADHAAHGRDADAPDPASGARGSRDSAAGASRCSTESTPRAPRSAAR